MGEVNITRRRIDGRIIMNGSPTKISLMKGEKIHGQFEWDVFHDDLDWLFACRSQWHAMRALGALAGVFQ